MYIYQILCGDEIAREKSPLQLLLDNKDDLERLNDELYSKKTGK